MAKPTAEQLSKINKFAKEPLSADDVHVHSFRLLGTGFIPSRSMQFDRSLLDKYMLNVKNGDVVQIADHSFGNGFVEKITLPFGRFFEGEVVADGEKYQLDGTMFMVKGAKTYIGDFTTDDISQQIDSGILHDSSVSVTWGYSECSICHNDIRDYEKCSHWPGRSYDVNGQQVQCYVIAKPKPENDNSMMIENSIVCAGAYPDAGVLADHGGTRGHAKGSGLHLFNETAELKLVKLDAPVFCYLSANSAKFHVAGEDMRDASELHQLYHQIQQTKELPEGWTFGTLNAKHKEVVKTLLDEGHEHFLVDALDGTLNSELKAKSTKGSENTVTEEQKLALEQALADLTTQNTDLKEKLKAKDEETQGLQVEVERLTALAVVGEKYREDIIAAALASGVRDQGNDFQEETYKKMFAALSIDEIKAFGEKWEESVSARLGLNQKTQGTDLGDPGGAIEQPPVDTNLYQVR